MFSILSSKSSSTQGSLWLPPRLGTLCNSTKHHVKMDQPQNTSQQAQATPLSWNSNGFSAFSRSPGSASSSNHTFLLPTSPSKRSRMASEYKPKVARTCGQRPACLVNASVTYCGNNQIYAFGGFDQYTDEGPSFPVCSWFFS